jgi:hypothetical protein
MFVKNARNEPYRCTILVVKTAGAVVTGFFGAWIAANIGAIAGVIIRRV